jgi:hypothetical protein
MAIDPSGMEAVCDLLTTYTFLVLIDGRWYLLNVAEQIINCKNIDGGGETKEEKGKDYDDPDCKNLRDSGVTKEGFERLKWEWGQTKTSTFGQEFGSMWIRDSGIPGGFDFVPMTQTFGPNGNPAMNLPSYSINDPNGGLVAMSHMHPAAFLPNGVGNNWTPAQYWKSSQADKDMAEINKVPSYIGSMDSLFFYDYNSKTDIPLMRGDWWDKDCF